MTVEGVVSRERQVRACALGTSALTLVMLLGASPASAQCAPDPTTVSGTTNCTGTDNDGLTVATNGTRVVLAADAIVRPGSATAAITSRAVDVSLRIGGLVDGGAAGSGILVASGPVTTIPCDPYAGASVGYCPPYPVSYPLSRASIDVLEGGTVTSAQGILIQRDPGDTSGYISVALTNAGTITGTAGPAVVAQNMGTGSLTVTNAATGTVGGIAGEVSSLTNAGRIDGGRNAALASSEASVTIVNNGRIVSSGTAATLSGTGALIVTNVAGATIGGSSTAIRAAGALTLTNAGTIDGSVVSTAGAGQASTIDTRGGTINGDLTLGTGDDTLRARYDIAAGRVTAITGTVDGGGGLDTLALDVDADAAMGGGVLPTSFERLGLNLSKNATVTLSQGLTAASGISVDGSGTLVNQATLVTSGPAVTSFNTDVAITNAGSVTATLSPGQYRPQAAVSGNGAITNSGSITATGGDGVQAYQSFANSGTITATGMGASISYGTFANSGVIRSTGGVGVALSGQYSTASTNDGTVAGATTGVAVSGGRLVNTGTITGGATGVSLGGTLVNSGRIAGGTLAVGAAGYYGNAIINSGTLAGSVDLTSPTGYPGSNLFVDDGGTVEGAIRLGGGDDQLVVLLGSDPARPLAGATGGVDAGAGYDTLRYRVNADATAPLALAGGFEGLAYELNNGAALTLNGGSDALNTTIGLAGNGLVTLNGLVANTDRTLIDATVPTVDQLTGNGEGPARDLAITNSGTLALATSPNFYGYNIAAIKADTATVTNTGTITVANAVGAYYRAAAISGGTTVANAGTITVTGGGAAIGYARDVINSGTIDVSGGSDSSGYYLSGVSYAAMLTNSGTIRADGTAVAGSYIYGGQVTNTGTIESRGGTAAQPGSGGMLLNEATGTIRGLTAIDLSNGGTVVNLGAIVGDMAAVYGFGYSGSTYVADGGTLTGNLTFGAGRDTLVAYGDDLGISGTVDGGDGEDTLIHARRATGTVTLGGLKPLNFELEGVRAVGVDTAVTVRADAPFTGDLAVNGDGTVVNTATIDGDVTAQSYALPGDPMQSSGYRLAGFVNQGTIAGGFYGQARAFTNSGTIGTSPPAGGVRMEVGDRLDFGNSGFITGESSPQAVVLYSSRGGTVAATNSGVIDGGINVSLTRYQYPGDAPLPTDPVTIELTNTGTITGAAAANAAAWLDLGVNAGATGSVTLDNSGTIEASGQAAWGAYLIARTNGEPSAPPVMSATNSGIIRANGGGIEQTDEYFGETYRYTTPAVALQLYGSAGTTATITNAATGVIEAPGERSTAILTEGAGLDLTNAGTIRGGAGTVLADDDGLAGALGWPYLAGAVQTVGDANDRIVNTGAILGSIDLGAGNDRVENYGRIEADVFLGMGDDTFLHRASATLAGTVDGGLGTDSLIVDATGGGAVNGDQFAKFERFSQIGQGNVTYSGDFRFATVGLSGGTITVAAGQMLSSEGAVTVTGSDLAETLVNNGTITGSVDMAGGNDRVVNRGLIDGAVSLGDADDAFVEGANSRIAGGVDGGAGDDLYTAELAGDRSGIGLRTGFERLSVEGTGTLSLVLDQNFADVALAGTGLNLALNGHAIGAVTGSDADEALAVDGDLALVSLGAGDDRLTLGATRAAGLYLGGAGNDVLNFSANAPVMLSGTATGFERVALDGNVLTIAGALGSAGAPLSFGDGDQQVTVAKGGTLAGVIDLGAGNDAFRLAAGGNVDGSVSGGTGNDTATLELAGDRTLAGGVLTDFETLATEGSGMLNLTGAHIYGRVLLAGNLSTGAGSSLTASQVGFGASDNRFDIAGAFAGSVDGGAGRDTIAVSGGSPAAPVAFGSIANVETYGQSAGYATVSGTAALGSVDMSGGRLIGLAGSIITASQIAVRQGATFGSAGTVNGNIAVSGTLSPGASPGTMTVNGNVAIGSGSLSLFELTPTVSDKLVVNGAVSIASGATLQLVPTGTLRPGTTYDLIVASGGITGGYATVLKPDTLFGFVIQRADRIQLLGQFLGDARFSPQVSRSIAYTNTVLAAQPATSTLFAALPALLTPSGGSNPQAFAQLTPEAYASATQVGVDNALTLSNAARGPAFATTRDTPGLFTFGQVLGQWHTLGADTASGTAEARTRGYGFLGGVGFGDADWSVGAFGGYLDTRQRIAALGAGTKANGFVAGVHGRYALGGFGLTASVLYDGSDARTTRALPGTKSASGRYDLTSWVSDLSASYGLDLASEWTLTPRVGITYVRTTRDAAGEMGGPFALTVARDRHVAGFADGGMSFGRTETSQAAFRPFVALGVRYQLEGRRADALASYAGGPLDLEALGVSRAQAVGTASAGVAYRFTNGLDLFSTASAQTGRDDHQETISTGIRLRF